MTKSPEPFIKVLLSEKVVKNYIKTITKAKNMDFIYQMMILGFGLVILATLWNILVSPKKKKLPDKLFKHFIQKYGFTTNDEATICSGVFANKNIQFTKKPFTANMQVPNPRGMHLLIEQGIQSRLSDLVETPIDGADPLTIKSNYPAFASQILDEELLNELKVIPVFSMLLKEGLLIRFSEFKEAKEWEKLLQLAAKIANQVEAINYAYG